MENDALFGRLCGEAGALGAYRAAVIPASEVETDASFRDLCKANVCGNYGKCWTCPPSAGEIEELMAKVHSFSFILVYQTVSDLEDSYDFEGMAAAGERHGRLMTALREKLDRIELPRRLYLGAGGCRICPVCAKKTDEPCRHPEAAIASLETYGVNVSSLAKAAGMKYINGQNTVTYFGGMLFDLPDGIQP